MEFKNFQIRTNYQAGDMGYMLYMHSKLYDFGLSFEMYVARTLMEFISTLDPVKECIWIAEDQNKMVGTIALKHTNGHAQLRYFLIDPEYRGRKIWIYSNSQYVIFLIKV